MKKEITIRKMISFFSLILLISFTSCNDDWEPTIDPIESGDLVVKTSQVINESYIGNGAQWDPYPQAHRYWETPISDADWNKLYTRLDYMKPSFMRVVIGSYDKYALAGADEYNPEDLFEGLNKILQYCQDNNITVMLGDWGYNQVDVNSEMIFENRLKNAARYIDFLVREKGFTCIKHYSTINEPNLVGSATNGNYELWKNATQYFYQELESLGVTGKVGIAGPDIAPFTRDITSWITDTTNDFGDKISIYDIHTYPPREWMFNGEYDEFLKIYKDATPAGSQIVIGEFGFKYETSTSTMDKELFRQNLSTINSDPNIARDSNTLIDEFFHGVDIAAATMKIVNAGYSGAATWNLDDAMHSGSTSGQDLKVWGFWNILGQELLGKPEKEELRPHFYSYSLLTRYMQTGAKVFTVDVPNRIGLDAIAVEKDGKYMIAINNIYTEDHPINIKFDNKLQLFEAKKFIYKENDRKVDDNGFPAPIEEGLTLDFGDGEDIIIPAQTLTVITNFDY